jgi:hypothetical protein
VSAADSTNKSQFKWAERTSQTTGPGLNKGTARLHYTDTSSTIGRPDDPHADVHAQVVASWHHEAPRPYTEDEIHFEEDAGPRDENNNRQGRLLTPGRDSGPTIHGLASTRQGRFASARGVGMMANRLEELTGRRDVSGTTNLSAQSAPLVSKLTGEEHAQTNTISFQDDPTLLSAPGGGRPEVEETESSEGLKTRYNRYLPNEVAKAGGQRLKQHMSAMRVNPMGTPGPEDTATYEQGQLMPEPQGHRGTTTFDTVLRHIGAKRLEDESLEPSGEDLLRMDYANRNRRG